MADVETTKGIADSFKDAVADVLNDTFGKTEQAKREPQNPVDQFIALGVLVILAIIPIIVGSWRAASNKNKVFIFAKLYQFFFKPNRLSINLYILIYLCFINS